MSLDFKAEGNFDQWRDQFTNALNSSASASSPAETIVREADEIAQRAVTLIQERAKEAGR
jgi:hypothetical protein